MAPVSLYFLLSSLAAHFEYVLNISLEDIKVSPENLGKEVDDFYNEISGETGDFLKYVIKAHVKSYFEKMEIIGNMLKKANSKIEALIKNETRLVDEMNAVKDYAIDRYCARCIRTSLETVIPKNIMNPAANYEAKKAHIHKIIGNIRARRKTELETILLRIGSFARRYLTASSTSTTSIPREPCNELSHPISNNPPRQTERQHDFKEEFQNIVAKLKLMNITFFPGEFTVSKFLLQIILLNEMINTEASWDYWKIDNAKFWADKYEKEWVGKKISGDDAKVVTRVVCSLSGLDVRTLLENIDPVSIPHGEKNYILHYVNNPTREHCTEQYTQCVWILHVATNSHFQSVLQSVINENRNETRRNIWKKFDRQRAIHEVCFHFAQLYDTVSIYDSHRGGPRLPDSICSVCSEHFKKYLLHIARNDPLCEDVGYALLKICPISE